MATKLELELNDDRTVTGSWCAVEAACPTPTAGEGGGGEGGGESGGDATPQVTVDETPGVEEPSAEVAVATETTVEPGEGTGEKPEDVPPPETTEGQGGEKTE